MSSSAPGKIILFGEHAVVYGYPAIAVPFGALQAVAESSTQPPGSGLVICAQETGQHLRVNASPPQADNPLVRAAQLVLTHFAANPPDLTLSVHSTIPMGGGFGSGAAVASVIMRELSIALGQPLEGDTLNALVYEIETIYHGTPSGIDNTVIVFNKPVYFVKGTPPQAFQIDAPFTFVVADSGEQGSTRETVGDVRKLREAEPSRVTPILERIGELVKAARTVIEQGDPASLGPLMVENHGLLRSLTVSSPLLERLVDAAMSAGALGSKLSGGGRGGNVIALARPIDAPQVAEALRLAGARRTWITVVEPPPILL
jgi:mevalonate kinase